jgi:hypothetical protein
MGVNLWIVSLSYNCKSKPILFIHSNSQINSHIVYFTVLAFACLYTVVD